MKIDLTPELLKEWQARLGEDVLTRQLHPRGPEIGQSMRAAGFSER